MPQALTPQLLRQLLRPGMRVYWPGCAAHSALFQRWFDNAPELAAGVTFCGAWIPGINRIDPCGWHADARAETFFMTPQLHPGWQRGAVDLLPWHYSAIARWMATQARFDVLLLQVAPPDAQGRCSLSVTADFAPAALHGLRAGAVVLAHVNPRLPRVVNGPGVAVADITAWVEADATPLIVAADAVAGDRALQAVARNVARLLRDGDTLQLGLGRLQAALTTELASPTVALRRLRIHSGMVADGVLDLLAAGKLAAPDHAAPPITTAVALGSERLYATLADPALARFAPVGHTHDAAVLAALPQLASINAALEIDLFGQVNCEQLGGRQRSGVGGLADFARGAVRAPGGRSIVAATACVESIGPASADGARGGALPRSRIVGLLAPGAAALTRADADTFVTEHGCAELRHLGVDARAAALIAIAAPAHREALQKAWHTLRRSF